jgi:hypothetical protein
MPGIGELIEGAVQQAPQPGRQETGWCGEFMKTNATRRSGGRSNAKYTPAGKDRTAAGNPVLDCLYMQVYIR